MIATVRRFLVLVALMFWLGGFTFYAGVVVPVGQHTIGRSEQSLVTRQVSIFLNLTAAIALFPLAWDILAARDRANRRRVLRWICLVAVGATLLALVWLHGELGTMLDRPGGYQDAGNGFRWIHRTYLWISTAQWAAGVLYTWLTLGVWRAEETPPVEEVK